MKLIVILIILGILIGAAILYKKYNEKLCTDTKFGPVTDIPFSQFSNANIALIKSDTLGAAPLGEPKYWGGTGSPVTQGMYGYNEDNTQTYYPVYTDNPF